MSLARPLASPFYEGTSASTGLVPSLFDVAIAGRAFRLDTTQPWKHESVPLLRPQADNSEVVSERSINPEGFWRRGQDSWHQGAGQAVLDRPGSLPHRFLSSKGVDPWGRWKLKPLNDTAKLRDSAATNLRLAVAGDYLYLLDGNEVYWTNSLTDPTNTAGIQAGEAAQAPTSITSDGLNVYAAVGTNGIHSTVRGSGVSAHFSDLTATLLAYVKGRLMAANLNSIYNIVTAPAAPAAHFTHPNSDFRWVGFAEGPRAIYAAGYSGDKSLIYRIGIQEGAAALDQPIVAGERPDGEVVCSLGGYLGFLLIGTNKGVRFAQLSTDGDVELGALIETGSAVDAFEGQDRFVWFSWMNLDASSTGLGRIDPTVFNEVAPAYASDLMAEAQGAVPSIVTFAGKRVFVVSSSGLWVEGTTPEPIATVELSAITFGLAEAKVIMFVDGTVTGSVEVGVSVDGAPSTTLGTLPTRVSGRQLRGHAFSIILRLLDGAEVESLLIEGQPAVTLTTRISAPVVLAFPTVEDLNGSDAKADSVADLAFLNSLRSSQRLVVYQEGRLSYSVVITDLTFAPTHMVDGRPVGTCLVQMKEVVA